MIAKLIVYKCRNCDSQNIVKNGHNASGSQQYMCKDCGKRGVLEPKRGYTEAQNPSGDRQVCIDRMGFHDDGTLYVIGPTSTPQDGPSRLE